MFTIEFYVIFHSPQRVLTIEHGMVQCFEKILAFIAKVWKYLLIFRKMKIVNNLLWQLTFLC